MEKYYELVIDTLIKCVEEGSIEGKLSEAEQKLENAKKEMYDSAEELALLLEKIRKLKQSAL